MRRSVLHAACFVFATALVAGCGDDGDPLVPGDTGGGRDAGTADGGDDDAGASDDGGVDDSGGGEDTGSSDGGDDDTGSSDGGDDDTGSSDTGSGDDTGGEDTGGFVCGEGVVFTGQVFRADDEPANSPNGGIPSFEPYAEDYDAGVAALAAAAVDQEDPVDVTLSVTEATVVATSFNNDTALRAQNNFWIADANATIEVRLDFANPDVLPGFPILVGQRVSFDVTQLGWYGDRGQVAAAENFTLVSENNPVSIIEAGADRPLTLADAPGVVRVTGTLVSADGPCGGSSNCFTMDYGAPSNIIVRSSSSFLFEGDCMTYVGPLSSFGGDLQLNTANFDWLFDYTFNEE